MVNTGSMHKPPAHGYSSPPAHASYKPASKYDAGSSIDISVMVSLNKILTSKLS